MSFNPMRQFFFILLFFALDAQAREYKPQSIEVYLTKQSQADAALWDKSCAVIGNKVVVRKGPWAFGFFSDAKCLPVGQEPARAAPWVMKVDSQGSQTSVEIMQRVVGDALTTIAATSFPFNAQNVEWLQNPEFANVIAASLLQRIKGTPYLTRSPNIRPCPLPYQLKIDSLCQWHEWQEYYYQMFPIT